MEPPPPHTYPEKEQQSIYLNLTGPGIVLTLKVALLHNNFFNISFLFILFFFLLYQFFLVYLAFKNCKSAYENGLSALDLKIVRAHMKTCSLSLI